MPFREVEQIMQTEQDCRAQKDAAEAKARELTAQAEREALERERKMRDDAAEEAAGQLAAAKARAELRIAVLHRETEHTVDVLNKTAADHMDAAADWIVERIVNAAWRSAQ